MSISFDPLRITIIIIIIIIIMLITTTTTNIVTVNVLTALLTLIALMVIYDTTCQDLHVLHVHSSSETRRAQVSIRHADKKLH